MAIQDSRRTTTQRAESRPLSETVFQVAPIPIIVSRQDDGQISSVNDAVLDFDERHRLQSELDRHASVRDTERNVASLSGGRRDVLLSATTAHVDGVPCIASRLVDITDRKAVEARIRMAARHDALAGLPNWALFHATLRSGLEQAGVSDARIGLILLDLDGFEEVNDTLGQESGLDTAEEAMLRQA